MRERFRQLDAQMALNGYTAETMARALGLTYKTMRMKLTGRRPFSLDEAIRIKTLLGADLPLETLFTRPPGSQPVKKG